MGLIAHSPQPQHNFCCPAVGTSHVAGPASTANERPRADIPRLARAALVTHTGKAVVSKLTGYWIGIRSLGMADRRTRLSTPHAVPAFEATPRGVVLAAHRKCVCIHTHPAHPAMEMQDTFHCFLGASSSGYATHKVLKRMLPLGVPNRSERRGQYERREAFLLPIKC
jgi:hypothetical protein